jgi:hypothetical protein
MLVFPGISRSAAGSSREILVPLDILSKMTPLVFPPANSRGDKSRPRFVFPSADSRGDKSRPRFVFPSADSRGDKSRFRNPYRFLQRFYNPGYNFSAIVINFCYIKAFDLTG